MGKRLPVITKNAGGSTYAEIEPMYNWDRTGWVTVRRWRGLLTDVTSLTQGKTIGSPFKATINPERYPWFILECSYKGLVINGAQTGPNPASQVVTLYGLRGGFETRTIWLLPKVAAEMRKITDVKTRNQVRAMMDALIQGQVVYQLPSASSGTPNYSNPSSTASVTTVLNLDAILSLATKTAPTLNAQVLRDLFGAFGRGVDGYRQEQVTFVMQQIAPPGANVVANYGVVQKPYSTPSLLSFCNARAPVPSIYTTALTTVFAAGAWIGSSPDVAQIDAQRFQIDQSWIYVDDFEAFVYGNRQ